MKLRSSWMLAFATTAWWAGELRAAEAEAPSFTIDGKTAYLHEAQLTERRSPTAIPPDAMPKSDRALRLTMAETDFPDLGWTIRAAKRMEIVLPDGQILL